MSRHTFAAPTSSGRIDFAHPVHERVPMDVETLPFTIKLVASEQDLSKAVRIRHAAYSRHIPDFAETLLLPEPADFETDAAVLLAESKFDGSPLGTARIQTNRNKQLSVEQSITLPDALARRQLAEVTRLGIDEGRIGRLVKYALIKACFLYCERNGVEWVVVAGRKPIDRQYAQLLFEDVFPGGDYIPMQHAGNLPHRVMAFEIESGHARWAAARHSMLKFFSYTHHPDIDVRRSINLNRADSLAAPAVENAYA